jgi:hypothetical protein
MFEEFVYVIQDLLISNLSNADINMRFPSILKLTVESDPDYNK